MQVFPIVDASLDRVPRFQTFHGQQFSFLHSFFFRLQQAFDISFHTDTFSVRALAKLCFKPGIKNQAHICVILRSLLSQTKADYFCVITSSLFSTRRLAMPCGNFSCSRCSKSFFCKAELTRETGILSSPTLNSVGSKVTYPSCDPR